MAGADMRGAIDTGRILFVVESNGQAASLRVIEGDSMESVPLDDPDVARAKWAGGDSVVFDTAAPPDRQVFRVADYHKFDPIQLTDATDGDNLGRAVTGVSADGAHLLVGQWTVDPLAPSGPIELSVAGGTKVARLDDFGHGCGDPDVWSDDASWSPDGSLLTYRCIGDFDTNTARVAVAHVDGSDPRTLTDEFAGLENAPKFSPDGTQILFARAGTLYVVPVKGGEPTPLFDVPDLSAAFYPDWSPDGTQVVFAWFTDGWNHNELRVADLDGSNMQTLWVGGPKESAELPDWGR